MPKKRQPKWAAAGYRAVMLVQHPFNQVFVDVDRERFGDLHGNCDPTASEARVALRRFISTITRTSSGDEPL